MTFGSQSALEVAGRDAERIADLFWWMTAGAAIVWAVVVGVALYAIRVRPGAHGEREVRFYVIGGGVAVPTVLLAALLSFALSLLPTIDEPPTAGSPAVTVTCEQWWWRISYAAPGGGTVELANELRLPLGERLEVEVRSPDVIHSFWIPSLAGKIDAVPGRVNRLGLEPTRTGTFRGVCAEYCGASHALMAFDVVVEERKRFEAWLAGQAAPAAEPAGRRARQGRQVFLAGGCGACHTVRGTSADGVVGPDLTHVGSRVSLAAGTLPNEAAAFERWLARPRTIKPGVHMPAFGMLPDEELAALAAYLEGLR